MSNRTYAQAKAEILQDLRTRGWSVVDGLKIPHATSTTGRLRLWFKSQAVYFTVTSAVQPRHDFHRARTMSYDLDTRTMTPEGFYRRVVQCFSSKSATVTSFPEATASTDPSPTT